MFLYLINYSSYEKDLCRLEMKILFNLEVLPNDKYFFSEIDINPSRSPFIKSRLKILYIENSLCDLIENIKKDIVSFKNFKVKYFFVEDKIEFKEKLKIESLIGDSIIGEAEIHEPDLIIGYTKIHEKWYLGEFIKNDPVWLIHSHAPNQYCNAVTTKIARSVVNIAVGCNTDLRLLDPCCGIGTVVMEALSMDINAEGYDINYNIIKRAKENFRYFEYPENVLKVMDMHNIDEKFDVLVLDIPYGILSITNENEQHNLIKTSRNIGKKLVLISNDEMDNYLDDSGFEIIDKCLAEKMGFKRFITLCR